LDRIPDFARVAHIDREALQAFDRLADVIAPDRRRDNALHIGHVETVASRSATVDLDIDVTSSRQAFRKGGGHTRDLLHHAFDLGSDAIDLLQFGAGDFHAYWAFDTGGEHIDSVPDRRHPDVGESRHLDGAVELL